VHRALVVVMLVLAAACTSGTTTTASEVPAPQTTVTTAVITTTTTTTTTSVPAQPQATPVEAANAFMQAWRAGDAQAAGTVALSSAVERAFAAGIPSSVQPTGCMTGGFDPTSCAFRTDLGEAQVRTTQLGGGWIVDQVIVSAL
jgi:type IV pilus biogenesis protein CpaD/CtpE